MGVSILSDGVGKPFSVRPAADDDVKLKMSKKIKSVIKKCLISVIIRLSENIMMIQTN